jgi:hypothetical protein
VVSTKNVGNEEIVHIFPGGKSMAQQRYNESRHLLQHDGALGFGSRLRSFHDCQLVHEPATNMEL